MTEAELKAIEERAERAKARHASASNHYKIEGLLLRHAYDHGELSPWVGYTRPTAEFWSAAYTDIPALLAHIRAVEAERDRMQALLSRVLPFIDKAADIVDELTTELSRPKNGKDVI